MSIERRLDQAALDARSSSVHEANLLEARVRRRPHVFGHDGPDVAWREGMEIELRVDRHRVWRIMVAHRYLTNPRYGSGPSYGADS